MFKYTSRLVAVLVGLGGISATTQANAAKFDFLTIANQGGEFGTSAYTLVVDGVGLTARGYNGTTQVFAYLDRINAGLGVCKTLSGTQCAPSNDDNVTVGERINLTFDQAVTLSPTQFQAEGHIAKFGPSDFVSLQVDGGPITSVQIPSNGMFSTALTGTSFDFIYNTQQFYIASVTAQAVPEPASLMLLGAGMLGMSLIRRRKA